MNKQMEHKKEFNCKVCGIGFIKNSNVQTYCSKQCNSKQHNEKYKSRMKVLYDIKAKEKRNKKCKICEISYFDESRLNKRLYCGLKCRNKEYSIRYKEKNNIYSNNYNKQYYEKNKEKIIETTKIWKKNNSEKMKIWHTENMREYRKLEEVKFKDNARRILNTHKKKYPQFYPNKCCFCEETKNIEFHHPNYHFPLSVYPVCRKHHNQIHHGSSVREFT